MYRLPGRRLRPTLALAYAVSFAPSLAQAAGFAIIEQGVSGLGNGYAGAAAVAEDASTLFYNPAGLILLEKPQAVFGLHLIVPQAQFRNEGTATLVGDTAIPTSGPEDDGGETAYVPNLYYAHPVSDRLVLGAGFHAPYGLATDYDDGWVGRYIGLRSHIATVNFNPSAALRLTDWLTLGAGLSIQYVEAELSSAIDFGLLGTSIGAGINQAAGAPVVDLTDFRPGGVDPATGQADLSQDGKLIVEGDDIAFGFNVGLLFQLGQRTRIGLHYRSHTDNTLEGDADYTVPDSIAQYTVPVGPNGAPVPILAAGGFDFSDQSAEAPIKLPETVSLSLFHQATDRLGLLADVLWTRWDRFDRLFIDYANDATPDTDIEEDWENVFRYSAGAFYDVANRIRLRTGVVYDESPVPNDELRSPRIPDQDRLWITFGLSWELSDSFRVDAAYVHIFVDDPRIDNDTHSTGQRISGTFDAAVDIFTLGGLYTF